MKVIDITKHLNEETEIYEGDPRFQMEIWHTIEDDGFRVSCLQMGTHTGMYFHAPCHFIEGGKSADEIPVRQMVGKCFVTHNPEDFPRGYTRVLIAGGTARRSLTLEQAQRLLEAGVQTVGTNLQSIGDDEVHRLLLGNECVILENLKLEGVAEGEYFLVAPPLKIEADGSPLRACLVIMDE